MSVTETTPQGPVPAIGIPDSQDYPRLVFTAPYFEQVPLAELITPSVTEAVEAMLPSLVPPYVDQAANNAVQQLAVLLVGSTMQGPLYLSPVMPTQPSQAASMAYVDAMIATAGVPEVPATPIGQTWARQVGQWVPISEEGGTFLPLAGGTMQGQINMSGNTITNMAALPVMPNGAAPAQWVLNQIASVSLYQGLWDMDTYTPDLTQLSTHVNGYTWIAITTDPSGVVIAPAIPGLQGMTIFNGDTVIWSNTAGAFQYIHAGGLSLPEAQALFLQLAGGQMSGPLLLNANATSAMQAVTYQQFQAAIGGFVTPDAPGDGQAYLRIGLTQNWTPGVPISGATMTGALILSGNATNGLGAVTLNQLNATLSGNFVPIAGGTMTGPLVLSGNATQGFNPVPLSQLNAQIAAYLPLSGGTLTGALTLSGNATAPLGAVTLQQLNAAIAAGVGGYLPLTGGTLTGPLTTTALTIGGGGNLNATGTLFGGGLNVTGGAIASSFDVGASGPSLTSNLNLPTTSLIWWSNLWNMQLNQSNNNQWTLNRIGAASNPVFMVDGSGNVTVTGAITMGNGANLNNNGTLWGAALNISGNGSVTGALTGGSLNTANNCNVGGVCYAFDFVTTSDPRTKTNIGSYTLGLGEIAQLNPITFRYNGLGGSPNDAATVTRIGLDASAVQQAVPGAVGTRQALLHPTDAEEISFLTLDTNVLLMTLINAVKQLISRVEALETAASITPSAADTA